MDFVIVTLITSFVALFAAGLYHYVEDIIKNAIRDNDLRRESTYEDMEHIVDTAKVKGSCNHNDYERFAKLQESYKAHGGNGASDRLKQELDLLPMSD